MHPPIFSQANDNKSDYMDLLSRQPCFAHLTPDQSNELLSLMQLVEFERHQLIVMEAEMVDAIYLIVSGKAEVSKKQKAARSRNKKIPLALLGTGEAIGLSDTGFYSKTGARTATVSALTKMKLLQLDLKCLHDFLSKHQLEDQMYHTAKIMLDMQFIKRSLPFTQLTAERINWLASRIRHKIVSAGTILFKEGDIGETCYLIKSGKVEIYKQDANLQHRQLAILSALALFGEATLITENRRNASAVTLEVTELLILDHALLLELFESKAQMSDMFMSLMIDRSQPEKSDNISIHHRKTADQSELTILKNSQNHQYFQLSKEGEYIWSLLDGRHTLQEITLALSDEFNLFAPDHVTGIISKLAKSGFIKNMDISVAGKQAKQAVWVKSTVFLQNLVKKRLIIPDADYYFSYLYHKIAKYFFLRVSIFIMLIISLAGMIVFINQTAVVTEFFSKNPASWWLLLAVIPLSFIEMLFHECGHAFAVKFFKYKVHKIGFALSMVGPVAFTDTSDMWLAPRWKRMVVNGAGVIVDLFVAGMASIFLFFINQSYLQCIIWLFVLYTYISIFRMLSPLYENDGYFLVMDGVEKHHLRRHAVVWLGRHFKKTIKSLHLIKKYKAELYYWLACIIYLIAVSLFTLFIQHVVFSAIGFQPANPYISLIIPFVVVFFTSLTVIAEIRSEAGG